MNSNKVFCLLNRLFDGEFNFLSCSKDLTFCVLFDTISSMNLILLLYADGIVPFLRDSESNSFFDLKNTV